MHQLVASQVKNERPGFHTTALSAGEVKGFK